MGHGPGWWQSMGHSVALRPTKAGSGPLRTPGLRFCPCGSHRGGESLWRSSSFRTGSRLVVGLNQPRPTGKAHASYPAPVRPWCHPEFHQRTTD